MYLYLLSKFKVFFLLLSFYQNSLYYIMVGFNPINVGRSLFRRGGIGRGIASMSQGLSRQFTSRLAKRTKRTTSKKPRGLQVQRGSKGNTWWPRFNTAPFPKSKHSVLKYTDRATLTGGLGGIVGGVFQLGLNCLFDPNLSGVGHQPMGYDQMTPIWQRWRVYKVEVKIRTLASTGNVFTAAMVTGSQIASPLLSGAIYTELNERRGCATTIVRDEEHSIIYGTFNIADIEGKSIMDDGYTGGTGGNPGNRPKLTIGIGEIGGGDVSSAEVVVEMVFYSWFNDLQVLQQS